MPDEALDEDRSLAFATGDEVTLIGGIGLVTNFAGSNKSLTDMIGKPNGLNPAAMSAYPCRKASFCLYPAVIRELIVVK